MKNYMKYICAFLLLLWTSAHAWGTTCTLYGGLGGNTVITTISSGSTLPVCSTNGATWDIATNWASKTYWTTTKYSSSSPTTTAPNPSNDWVYLSGDVLPDGVTALYAVYSLSSGSTYYSGAPGYQLSLSPTTGDSYAAATKYVAIQPGTSITITAYPDDGLSVTSWTVLDDNLDDITPTSTTATTFTFTMPSSDVIAEVEFDCNDLGEETLTINDPTLTWNSTTDKWDINITWNAVKGATSYTIACGDRTTSKYVLESTVIGNVTSYDISGLINGHEHRVLVRATHSCDATYKQLSKDFTPTCSAPTVSNSGMSTTPTSSTTLSVSGGKVTNIGGCEIVAYGYVYGTSANPTWSNSHTGTNEAIAINTQFGSKTISELTPGTTYYIRPVAISGTASYYRYGYGDQISVTMPYAITLDKNEGDNDGSALVQPNATSLMSGFTPPTKTGYHVEGYYTTSGVATKVATDEGALQASIEVSSTEWTNSSSQWVKAGGATFYAKWAANNYTVTLDPNGGSGDDQTVTATYGSAMPTTLSGGGDIVIPTKDGYDFAGYYYGETQYYDEDGNSANSWDRTSNTTLTARWETVSPTITIVANSHVTISSTTPSIAAGSSSTYTAGNTVTLNHGEPSSGYYWLAWNVYETGNESNIVTVTSNQFTMPTHNVTVTAKVYTSDIVFSCSELTLTPHLVTASTPIFITSTASKTVRSQDYIEITGNGLTPSTELTFPDLPAQFAIKNADGTEISTNGSGAVSANAYIFYTPGADETTDGLLKITGITVAVGGDKPKQKTLTYDIIGRHLPTAGYVIAGKKDNKWYALPSNMSSTTTPAIVEIAVDDINNPSIAYTAASNIYGLEGPTNNNISDGNGQYVRLTMSITDGNEPAGPAPLFGTTTSNIGKSGNSKATSDLSAPNWWQLTQTNTSITNPQDAKYTIKCANNSNALKLYKTSNVWGQYAYGSDVAVSELRIIPASDIPFTETYFVEWGQHGGVIEVDATGIDATSVVAHLNGASSSAITLSQTGTASKGGATKYNYTVNFGEGINFAAPTSKGALLLLDWKNGETTKAMTSLVVPKIIASSSTMSSHGATDGDWSSTEVHVLPGVTLTANAGDFTSKDVTIDQLEIYPGATVIVTKGSQDVGTLDVRKLILRNGWTRAGEKRFDVARLYITPSTANLTKTNNVDKWYSDWYIDYDQYYSMSVPFPVTTSEITYKNTSSAANTSSVKIRYYDGENRALTGQTQIGQNWKDYNPWPTYLEPSKGYAISAKRPTGKAFSIIRMPLTFSNPWGALGEQGNVTIEAVTTHKDQVSITGWGKGTADWYAMGWNFIGNPYMSTFNGDDSGISGKLELQNGGSIKYATIPDVGFHNYDQVAIAEANISPASGFFIQAENPAATYVTFASTNIVPPSAPTRFKTTTEAIPEQEAYIRLSYDGGKDQMGLIIGEDYTENYEVNADLAKVLGDAGFVKTYMQYGGMDMAYVAINSMLAQQWIPVTVILPTSGEYTFSLTNSSVVEQLEGVYLIDYANENQVTNLIDEDYVFTSEAGTIGNRFSINAIVGERQTPTDVDIIGADKDSKEPIKFLYHEKVYIYHHGVIYDATGKKVREINK